MVGQELNIENINVMKIDVEKMKEKDIKAQIALNLNIKKILIEMMLVLKIENL